MVNIKSLSKLTVNLIAKKKQKLDKTFVIGRLFKATFLFNNVYISNVTLIFLQISITISLSTIIFIPALLRYLILDTDEI